MGRRNLSARAIRDFAPVLIPLVTKVVVPMAVRNLQRSKSDAEDVFDGARGRFERKFVLAGVSRRVTGAAVEFQVESGGEGAHELLVGIGIGAADLVIEVDDGEDNAEFGARFQQQAQQRDRIGAAGNRHANAISGPHQAVMADVAEDAVEHGANRTGVRSREGAKSLPSLGMTSAT